MWIDELKSSDLVSVMPYMTLNKNLNNFIKIQFSMAYHEPDELLNRDKLVHLVSNEFNMAISNEIMKDFNSVNVFDYIDKSGVGDIQVLPLNELIKIIEEFYHKTDSYKYLITNGNLGTFLQDSSRFTLVPITNSISNWSSLTYNVGKFGDLDVWVDPVLEWKDTTGYLFDGIDINIGDFTATISNQATFTPRLVFDLEIDFRIINPKIFFVVTDKTSKSYSRYKSLLRDIKINDVLDEEN